MKTKLILMCAVVAISLCLFACFPTPKEVSVDASCDDFMKLHAISKEVEVAVDGSLTVTLCSNPSTGFKWEEAQISDETVVQQTDQEFISPEYLDARPPPPGSPGKEVWTFKALKEGKATISLKYTRPWEEGQAGVRTFNLTVVVK